MDPWLHAAVRKQPERIALEAPGRRLTYVELARSATDAAAGLQALGVRAGERVALEIDERLEFLIAFHACLLLGAPAVPVDLRLSTAERETRRRGAAFVLRELPGAPGGEPPIIAPDRGTTATVMNTSGTTSDPKPVELTYENWLANALASAVALGLDPQERWLCPMPLTHVGGLSIPIRSTIYATTAVLHPGFETESVLGDLMDPARRITLVSLVPTMLARLLDAGLHEPPALRWALLGGGPIPAALLARARAAAVPVAPTYGMTEACSQIATFGWPLPGVDVRLDQGEVLVRGAVVARASLASDGWLHTGDLGRFDNRGRLEITGRRADTIVTGGENVAPAEVEAVLLEHPAVQDAGVFGRPDAEWGEAVSAVVVLRDGPAVEPADLRAFCAERLAPFKVPKVFGFAPALPRTGSGKLLRQRLSGLV
jgi:O-succinylbenzoic acid--CoA ligase